MKLRSITPGVISTFKSERLKVKTRNGKVRSIASVHRELEILVSFRRAELTRSSCQGTIAEGTQTTRYLIAPYRPQSFDSIRLLWRSRRPRSRRGNHPAPTQVLTGSRPAIQS